MSKTKIVERGFFKSSPIKLNEGGQSKESPNVQVLRVGAFNHPKYGEFEITRQTLAEMKANFDARVRGVDIAFDYFHESDKEASGWPTELFLSDDKCELWAVMDWTPKAKRMLAERELRYFSPDFAFQWEDPETGVVYNNVLFGGGLTNRPFVKDMSPIVASEIKGENEMELKEIVEKMKKLSEDQGSLKDSHDKLKKENEDMKKKLAEYEEKNKPDPDGDDNGDDGDDQSVEGLKKQLVEMGAKLKKAEADKESMMSEKKMAEKNAAFTLMLSEGKACVAQKEAYLKGDMDEFVKLAEKLNTDGKGSSANGGTETSDREDRVLKLAEEKVKKDPKLNMVDAITMAHKEISK